MKRSALYALVWSRPVTHIAKELGLSGPGLAKVCRRHAIPLPSRGHWAKLQAGKVSPQVELPRPEADPEVSFSTSDAARRRVQVEERAAQRSAVEQRVKQIREAKVVEQVTPGDQGPKPHPLVKATAAYCARIPQVVARYNRMAPLARATGQHERPPYKEHERWRIDVPDGLVFVASDAAIEGVLKLYDTVFRALTRAGGRVFRQEPKGRDGAVIVCERSGERIAFSLREGYRRLQYGEATFAKMRAEKSWASQWYYEPSGKLTWTVSGTEPSLSKNWTGTEKQLAAKQDEIIATCLELLEQQPVKRQDRLAEAERRRLAAEEAERARRISTRRREQLELAFKAAAEYDRVQSLKRFLDVVETERLDYREPYDERAKIWLAVVREELEAADPYRALIAQGLTVPSWQTWPPEWWPESTEESDCAPSDPQ
jgi:hypothetical protein